MLYNIRIFGKQSSVGVVFGSRRLMISCLIHTPSNIKKYKGGENISLKLSCKNILQSTSSQETNSEIILFRNSKKRTYSWGICFDEILCVYGPSNQECSSRLNLCQALIEAI